jgi:guanine deaminase
MAELLVGQILAFDGDPFAEGADAARHDARGGVLIDGGRIVAWASPTICAAPIRRPP